MKELIQKRIRESIDVKVSILENKELINKIANAVALLEEAISQGKKVILCGNGGSASDASHIAGELVGRFQKERRAIPAIALNDEVTVVTAVANDYGYDMVFARAVEGFLNPGDVLIGISTSGNSRNVICAMKKAQEIGGITIALTGGDGGAIKKYADVAIVVDSDVTARVQESHIMIGHIMCELLEDSCL